MTSALLRRISILQLIFLLGLAACSSRSVTSGDVGGLPGPNLDAGGGAPMDGTGHPADPDQHGEQGLWTCDTSEGTTTCVTEGGLPARGEGWLCHQAEQDSQQRWICQGQSETDPSGQGWSCKKVSDQVGTKIYRCWREVTPADRPSSGGIWACTRGSYINGTRCELVERPGLPRQGDACSPGQRLWCDDPTYDGWGQVICDPVTRTWRTRTVNGKKVLDCQESPSGKVPLTACACYHAFFNAVCCERTDCIVPRGTGGQICPQSPGNFCAPCNPMGKSGCMEPGAHCVTTQSNESFCSSSCEVEPCPEGSSCVAVKSKQGSIKQCVPEDLSCYF